MLKLSIHKIIVTGAGLAGGGSGLVWMHHKQQYSYQYHQRFPNPFIVHAAEAESPTPVNQDKIIDKYAALYTEPAPVPPKPPLR